MMKEKKIIKIAKVKTIESPVMKRNIAVICKVLDSTQNSQFEEQKFTVQQKVPEKKYHQKSSKTFRKQKNTAFSSSENSFQSSEFMPERQQVRVSQTKNISTSYGKMILRFMEAKKQQIKPILQAHNVSFADFLKTIEYFTRHMFSVSDLRKLWIDHPLAKVMRIFSMNFLRKHSYEFIFNSRIKMYERNLKYRHKIIEGVQKPQGFNMLKDF